KSFGCVRKVYNLMLDDRKKAYEEVKNDSSKKMTFPTPAKYKNFFRDKSVGFPRFKSKKNPVQSYTTNNQNGTVALIDSKFI
ncbi:helix-turn-helix domain-containing protein, partial [Enterococcus faecium]|uniref:helix-turn-helix domain-containing protein n=1 Tax=Enterococcus faecium TaxID=1352 RepID=UPI00287F6EC6